VPELDEALAHNSFSKELRYHQRDVIRLGWGRVLVLDHHGLIRHHIIERPFAKDDLGHWTHWAALIREKESGELFAVDSSAGANGENPTIQSAASFYVPDTPGDNKPPEGFVSSERGLMALGTSGGVTGAIR